MTQYPPPPIPSFVKLTRPWRTLATMARYRIVVECEAIIFADGSSVVADPDWRLTLSPYSWSSTSEAAQFCHAIRSANVPAWWERRTA